MQESDMRNSLESLRAASSRGSRWMLDYIGRQVGGIMTIGHGAGNCSGTEPRRGISAGRGCGVFAGSGSYQCTGRGHNIDITVPGTGGVRGVTNSNKNVNKI